MERERFPYAALSIASNYIPFFFFCPLGDSAASSLGTSHQVLDETHRRYCQKVSLLHGIASPCEDLGGKKKKKIRR